MEKLIVISAPSGAGKTSIVHFLLKQNLDLSFSVSACNRDKREGETEGDDYYFLSTKDFKNRIKENAFLEWEEVYQGRYYGTLNSEVQRIWNQKKHIIFDIDVKGGINIKNKYKERCLSLFIMPPSVYELESRLLKRETESKLSLNMRLEKAKIEISFSKDFDKTIINDDFNEACKKTLIAVKDFLRK